jgi:hypothetical protein
MQSKTSIKVHEGADLPWRYRCFKDIAMPKFSKVKRELNAYHSLKPAHPFGNLSVRQFSAD